MKSSVTSSTRQLALDSLADFIPNTAEFDINSKNYATVSDSDIESETEGRKSAFNSTSRLSFFLRPRNLTEKIESYSGE